MQHIAININMRTGNKKEWHPLQRGGSCDDIEHFKYCRVRIKCPWVGTISMLQKRGVGTKCILST